MPPAARSRYLPFECVRSFFFFFFFGLPQDGTVELLPCTAGFPFFCFSWCPSARISHGERRFVEDLVEMPPLADYPSITAL